MSELTPEEQYQKEYDAAYAALDAADTDKPVPTTVEEVPKEAEAEPNDPPKAEEPPEEAKPVDPLEELRTKLEKAEKALKDTQKWGHENAARLKEIERQRLLQEREATRPAILDANPDLEEAIRHVASDPKPQIEAETQHQQWVEVINSVHPGIFQLPEDDELVKAIDKRRLELGSEWGNPLVAIREITAEKLAHAERQAVKKNAAEAANNAKKAAMSVPSPGGNSARAAPADKDKEEVARIQKMSPEEFEKERRRVLGYN